MTEKTKCQVCGKTLERPESIALGIGPECMQKFGSASAVTEHMATLQHEEVPPQFVPLAEARAWAIEQGFPASRMLRAAGGNRGYGGPIDPIFQLAYVKGKRYISKSVMTQKGKKLLEDMVTSGRPSKKEVQKEEAPAPKPKAPRKKKRVTEAEPGGKPVQKGKPVASPPADEPDADLEELLDIG